MNTNAYPEPAPWRTSPLPHRATGWRSVTDDAAVEFGRFRVLLRRRRLLADGVPVELGTRALDVLLVLLEADGALVTKEELLRRAWLGIAVSDENLKVQVSNLRKALGADRNLIRTEIGRGYRFIGILRSTPSQMPPEARRAKLRVCRALLWQNGRQSFQCGFNSNW
jgi:DNA-binding winged helix-turn-helix (wHTH) protein